MKSSLFVLFAFALLTKTAFADGHTTSITLSGTAQAGFTNGANGGDIFLPARTVTNADGTTTTLSAVNQDKTDTRRTGAGATHANQNKSDVYSSANLDINFAQLSDANVVFGAQIEIDSGEDFDTSDVEFDGDNTGTPSLGEVFVAGRFGKLTFHRDEIDDLYDDGFGKHDLIYSGAFQGNFARLSLDFTVDVNGVTRTPITRSDVIVSGPPNAQIRQHIFTSFPQAENLTDPAFGSTYSLRINYVTARTQLTFITSDAPNPPVELDAEYAISDSFSIGLNYDTKAANRTERIRLPDGTLISGSVPSPNSGGPPPIFGASIPVTEARVTFRTSGFQLTISGDDQKKKCFRKCPTQLCPRNIG